MHVVPIGCMPVFISRIYQLVVGGGGFTAAVELWTMTAVKRETFQTHPKPLTIVPALPVNTHLQCLKKDSSARSSFKNLQSISLTTQHRYAVKRTFRDCLQTVPLLIRQKIPIPPRLREQGIGCFRGPLACRQHVWSVPSLGTAMRAISGRPNSQRNICAELR